MQAKHKIVVLKNMLLALMIECSVNSKEGNGHIGIVFFFSLVIDYTVHDVTHVADSKAKILDMFTT
jgi:hypothetical protein